MQQLYPVIKERSDNCISDGFFAWGCSKGLKGDLSLPLQTTLKEVIANFFFLSSPAFVQIQEHEQNKL